MKRLLIANRGEIACRILRTARRMGLATVAVHSDADRDALHVRAADHACSLGGLASAESYLRVDKIIAAAQSTGADAVHPGYGFLSENADFAQAVIDAGLIWVGPPPAAIRALGSKSASKAIAQARGIPCLGGYFGADQADARFAAEAERVGYPLMVKATAGGGGRGMRLVRTPPELAPALASARAEALAAFGSAELLIERAVLAPRHVEVQIFADTHGQCVHLGERDCSIQRRHQKLVEETPSPALSDAVRTRLCESAVRLAQAAGYVGAGTVEFLVERDQHFLMEMNTRLQVEHPVTEMVIGMDLVEWQLRVARGERLPLQQADIEARGHAIEVRLCAEDENFVPHTGTVGHLRLPSGADTEAGSQAPQRDAEVQGTRLRFDHSIAVGGQVSPYYDSMLGKLVVHAPTRAQAIDRLVAALGQLVVLGLPTNRAMLLGILRHPVFAAGQALIPFLDDEGQLLRDEIQKREQDVMDGCSLSALLSHIPGGSAHDGRLPCPYSRPHRWRHRGQVRDEALAVVPPRPAGLHALAVGGLATPRGGGARRWHVQWEGVDLWLEDASYDPPVRGDLPAGVHEMRAPFNGKIVAVPVAAGQVVNKGDAVVIIESMKIEHRLVAPDSGTLAVLTARMGQQVATHDLLARIEPPLASPSGAA